jgi:hypothetical protein
MNTRCRLVLALAVILTATQVAAQNTFTVTGPSSFPFTSYDIDGHPNPTLTVIRGQTYSFNLVNCTIHPFNIQSTQGILGTRYVNVTNNGGTSGTVTLTVPIQEPANVLFYQCGNHSPMNGTINIVDPTAVSTPTFTTTPTPTPVPTFTATLTPTQTPVPTFTATPTPTRTAVPCTGDCSGNGQVTVDEILTMVNIALGNADVSACTAGDANGSGQITVDEILTAVNNALGGCGAPLTSAPVTFSRIVALARPPYPLPYG